MGVGGGTEQDGQAEDFPGLSKVSEKEPKGHSDCTGCQGVFFLFFFWLILFLLYFTLQYCIGFAIH